MSEFAWSPTPDIIENARLTEFLRLTGARGYADLYERSIRDIPSFTEDVLRFLQVQFDNPYTHILDLSHGPEWPHWCVDAKLNIVKSCLRHDRSQTAVIGETESGALKQLTYGELGEQVARFAAGLKSLGISKGDRIGIYMAMIPETVVTLLAIGYIGAIAVPLFSGYGPTAIETRLNQTSAKALIASASFERAGKRIDMLANAREALHRCPTVEHLIVHGVEGATDDVAWGRLLTRGAAECEITNAEDPLIIIFSSGTTGEPKGIVHSHCSFPVKSAQDMAFHMDVHAGDRVSWISDLGWMMGPWLIYGGLILGATVVLYDGSCDYPEPDRLWRFTAQQRLTMLGVSPSLIRKLAAFGSPQTAGLDLSALRFFASSGEPWDPASWWWLFQSVRKGPGPIINYSGGTEISGGILSNHPLAPMKPRGFAGPCPGVAADVVDDNGSSLPGGVGELAIRAPWIGQARGFWDDPDRYLNSYWSRVPGLWIHGDWAERDSDGQWFIHGRSDDTLKIVGKRVGPAEVESVLTAFPGVTEAAVIGIPDPMKGTALIGFCVGRQQDGICRVLQDHVAKQMGRPLKPERIHFVSALPKTRNGKIVRRAIRAAYLRLDAGDLSALDNPSALDQIRTLNA